MIPVRLTWESAFLSGIEGFACQGGMGDRGMALKTSGIFEGDTMLEGCLFTLQSAIDTFFSCK